MLFLAAVVLPVVVAERAGALGIPRSDDWSYLLTLFRLIDHGRLGFNNWVSMTLVGQLGLAAPVAAITGNSITATHVFVALVGFAGLVGLVCSVPSARRGATTVLALSIALGPLWPALAPTFMTDIPAFALQCLFIALAVRALPDRGPSVGRYAVALAVGCVAIAIRQYEAIPVLAVAIVAIVVAAQSGDRARVRNLLAVTGIAAVVVGALFAWWLALPDSLSLAPSPLTSGVVANLAVRMAGFMRLVGVLLLPVLLLAGPANIVRAAWRSSAPLTAGIAATMTLWMTVTYLRVPEIPFVGNYMDRYGVLSRDVLIGPRVPVMPSWIFTLLAALGSVAAVVLVLAAVPAVVAGTRRVRAGSAKVHDPIAAALALAIAGFAAAYAVAVATDLPVFDRYALPILPLVGLLVVRGPLPAAATEGAARSTDTGRRVAVVASLVVLGCVALVLATDSASYDAARWKIDGLVVRQGVPATRINGGFEWISWHSREGPPQGNTVAERQRLRAAYLRPFCVDVIVNPGPRQAARAIARVTVHGLGHGPEQMVAVRNGRSCHGAVSPSSGP